MKKSEIKKIDSKVINETKSVINEARKVKFILYTNPNNVTNNAYIAIGPEVKEVLSDARRYPDSYNILYQGSGTNDDLQKAKRMFSDYKFNSSITIDEIAKPRLINKDITKQRGIINEESNNTLTPEQKRDFDEWDKVYSEYINLSYRMGTYGERGLYPKYKSAISRERKLRKDFLMRFKIQIIPNRYGRHRLVRKESVANEAELRKIIREEYKNIISESTQHLDFIKFFKEIPANQRSLVRNGI